MGSKFKNVLWWIALAVPILLIVAGSSLLLWTSYIAWQHDRILDHGVVTFREQLQTTTETVIPIIWETTPDSTEAAVTTAPAILPELRLQIEEYNRAIYETGQAKLVDKQAYQQAAICLADYGIKENIAGVISIPKIDVEMPVYLGATDENMAKGFAHLGQTSMPIGGESTNCVVAGHRGWRGAAYMRDVHLLEIGDAVYVENLWETLEYRIVKYFEIDSDDTEHILIQPGRDLLTIITCTSHDSGNHRILVICERFN